MSLCMRHIYGYGLCLDEAGTIGRYLKPEYRNDFINYGCDWRLLFTNSGYSHDGITTVETNGQGDTYLCYHPNYPWKLNQKEKELTSVKDVEKDMLKYLNHFFIEIPDNLPFRELNEEGWN